MLDLILVLALILFSVRGFKRGLAKEVFSLLAIVIATVLAFLFADSSKFFIQDLLTVSIGTARILAFISIFLLSAIAFNVLVTPLSKLAQISIIRPLDKISGTVFGVIEGLVIIGVVLAIMSTSVRIHRAVEHSFVARAITDAARTIFSALL